MKKEEIFKRINPLFLQGICHRGYFNKEVSENSLKAFQNAIDINMAIELDIHVTKDDKLIVIHDSEMKRLTGKDGVIEDLTFDEIRNNYKLLDGQIIPSFKEVIDLVNEQVPISIELKTYKGNYKKLVKQFKKEVSILKNKENYMLISFDPRALLPCKKLGFITQFLMTDENQYRYLYMFRNFFHSYDIDFHMLKNPKVIKFLDKSKFINIWTIESFDNMDELLKYADTLTFQLIDGNKVKEILINKNKKFLNNIN